MIHELLRRQPLFKGLSDSQIATLAGTVEVVDVPEGTLLFAAGGPAGGFGAVIPPWFGHKSRAVTTGVGVCFAC